MRLEFQRFVLGDVDFEDVDIFIAFPIYDWQKTQKGQWVMEHAQNLTYHRACLMSTLQPIVMITGDLDGVKLTEYLLKWANLKSS